MMFISQHTRGSIGGVLLPGMLELGPVAFRTIAVENSLSAWMRAAMRSSAVS